MTGPLAPTAVERIALSTGPVEVPKCSLQLQQWTGPAVEDTFGGKAVLDFDGDPLFAELVILRLLGLEGWEGVWVDSFGRRFLTGLPSRVGPALVPEPARLVYEAVAAVAGERGGCWDVLAWRGGEHRFLEAKRRRRDAIREG